MEQPKDTVESSDIPFQECSGSPSSVLQSINKSLGGVNNLLGENDYSSLQLLDVAENDPEDETSNHGSDSSVYDSEVPEEEIDALLEEGLPDEMKGPPGQRKKDSAVAVDDDGTEYKEKIVVIEKGTNILEPLPEGWVKLTHSCGMPLYLHRKTRACTLSRPYFLGKGSARYHEVPLCAIPCLQYRRELQKDAAGSNSNCSSIGEQLQPAEGVDDAAEMEEFHVTGEDPAETCTTTVNETSEETPYSGDPSSNGSAKRKLSISHPLASKKLAHVLNPPQEQEKETVTPPQLAVGENKVEVQVQNLQHVSLDALELRQYCEKLFQFKKIQYCRFKSWTAMRKHRKMLRQRERPLFPKGTQVISVTRPDTGITPSQKKEWVMNPKGKSYLCILHEYVQQALKERPVYVFTEVDNAVTPYAATVKINNVEYGTGYGSSKKIAKKNAAQKALEVLLPQLGEKIRQETNATEDADISFFDEIKVEDPRVGELCNKTSELSPYSVLLNCLQKNFGLSGAHIESKLIPNKKQKNEYVMTVGKHTVTVKCKNKKDGKQMASQAILQKLHPYITSWGSLLRLYGNHSVRMAREKKEEERKVTYLQANAAINKPNTSIINKLKEEMLKLQEVRNAVKPIGVFKPPENISLPTASGIDLNNVNL